MRAVLHGLLAASVMAVSAPTFAQTAAPAVPTPAVTATPPPSASLLINAQPADLTEALSLIDAEFDRWQAANHIPGRAYGVVRDGQIIHLRTTGERDVDTHAPVQADTLFRIASMSKAFTALAILKLRDDGKLSLDAPAETYVPELAGWTYPTTDSPRIRVRDLLNHISGLVTDNPWGDRQQVMTEAEFTAILEAGVPMASTPGTVYAYSNFGYALLGRIITNVSGQPYDAYIRQEILLPLGMTATTYDVFASPQDQRAFGYRWENDAWSREPDMKHGVFGAMGGIETNSQDYARWIGFLLSAWPASDAAETGPVRRATVRELATGSNFVEAGVRTRPDGSPCATAQAYGMALSAATDCELGTVLSHSGGYPGYGSIMILLPERGVGLFAFGNRTYAGASRTLRQSAIALVRSGAIPAREIRVSPALAQAYATTQAVWTASDVSGVQDQLAMNFLLDRSVVEWRTVLGETRAKAGDCVSTTPVTATSAMSVTFDWVCDNGRIDGEVLLAPTTPPTIQEMIFTLTPTEP